MAPNLMALRTGPFHPLTFEGAKPPTQHLAVPGHLDVPERTVDGSEGELNKKARAVPCARWSPLDEAVRIGCASTFAKSPLVP